MPTLTHRSGVRLLPALIIVAVTMALAMPAASAAPWTKLISQQHISHQSAQGSSSADVDLSGNTAVFAALGDEFLSVDDNGFPDVYRRNVNLAKTKMVSRGYGGAVADGSSLEPQISSTGRYVVFRSTATNLTPNHVTGTHVYRRDLFTGKTKLVSKGASGPADRDCWESFISAGGRYIVFSTQAKNLTTKSTKDTSQIYLRDMKTKKTYLISQAGGKAGDGWSSRPSVSADGRFVAFGSQASNLWPKDERGQGQVFVRDRKLGKTYMISKHPTKGKAGDHWSTGPVISADGRTIVFTSWAENLIKWGADDNGVQDVYKYDRVRKMMARVSVDRKGRQLNDHSHSPDLSADGKVIVFTSSATNAIKGGTDGTAHVYRRGLKASSIKLASRSHKGVRGNGHSWGPRVSANGRWVVFTSHATNLFAGKDDNGSTSDVFRRGPF